MSNLRYLPDAWSTRPSLSIMMLISQPVFFVHPFWKFLSVKKKKTLNEKQIKEAKGFFHFLKVCQIIHVMYILNKFLLNILTLYVIIQQYFIASIQFFYKPPLKLIRQRVFTTYSFFWDFQGRFLKFQDFIQLFLMSIIQ